MVPWFYSTRHGNHNYPLFKWSLILLFCSTSSYVFISLLGQSNILSLCRILYNLGTCLMADLISYCSSSPHSCRCTDLLSVAWTYALSCCSALHRSTLPPDSHIASTLCSFRFWLRCHFLIEADPEFLI